MGGGGRGPEKCKTDTHFLFTKLYQTYLLLTASNPELNQKFSPLLLAISISILTSSSFRGLLRFDI